MQQLDKHTVNTVVINPCPTNSPHKPTFLHCCEVLIDYRTCLFPEPICFQDIRATSTLQAKIDKSCSCKVLIGGILHKTIMYKSKDFLCETHEYVKYKDIPFSCYVDVDYASSGDIFKIAGADIILQSSELKKVRETYSTKAILIMKDIIKIAVQSN